MSTISKFEAISDILEVALNLYISRVQNMRTLTSINLIQLSKYKSFHFFLIWTIFSDGSALNCLYYEIRQMKQFLSLLLYVSKQSEQRGGNLISLGYCNEPSQAGQLIHNRNLFLKVLEAGSTRSQCNHGGILERTLYRFVDSHFLPVSSRLNSSLESFL